MVIKYAEVFYLNDIKNQLNIVSDMETLETYRLYWTYEREPQTENKTYLLSSDKKQLEFEFAYDKKRRNYFILEWPGQRPLLFGHRILPAEGMYNLRDIGGYLTDSGRRIKWGVGYRSDYFHHLKDSGMEYMKSLGIKTIIDLRSKEEIEGFPNRKFDEETVTYNFDPNANTAMEAGTLHNNENLRSDDRIVEMAKQAVKENPNAGDQRMMQQQLNFVTAKESKDAFRRTLEVLSNPDSYPSIQHCRGGKDRTGFSLALLEGILGVPKDLLIYDYMLTYRAREEKNTRYYQRYLELAKDEKIAKYLYSFFDTKSEYIEASINKIIEEYGTFAGFVKQELGITDEMIEKIKSIYLED